MGRFHIRYWAKAAVFTAAIWLCLASAGRILTPKFFYTQTWRSTATYLGFYQMDENTVDVLFFGSSHAASGFSPQKLYDEYGIRSYNLGSDEQNLLVSYYWLLEALRFQTPKAVVLDCYMLFPYDRNEALNTSESCTRKAIDYMKWSGVKRAAVKDICALDEKQSAASYYFPNIRYHTRWMSLNEDDFAYKEMSAHYEMKGFTALPGMCGNEEFEPFEENSGEDAEAMVELMRAYLDWIEALCRERGIRLLLVKTPTTMENPARCRAIRQYAQEKGIPFYDFNEKPLYESTGLHLAADSHDNGHGNIWGAEKVTSRLGKILSGEYGIAGQTDHQWEDTKAWYEGVKKDCELIYQTGLSDYLACLDDARYTVFMAIRGEEPAVLPKGAWERMNALGLKENPEGKPGLSYYAVAAGGAAIEAAGSGELATEGRICGGRVSYEIKSTGAGEKSACSIRIGESELSRNRRGLNVVVYNHVTKTVVDSVCFDIMAPAAPASR